MTEQLALEERCRHRRAVDRDKRLLATRREVVQRAGDELLTGTGLAGDQDRRIAIGDAADMLDGPRIAGLLPAMPSIGTSRSAAERRRLTSRLRDRCSIARPTAIASASTFTGLVMKSYAPARIAAIARVEPALTGQHDREEVGVALAGSWHSSTPEIPAIWTSVTTTSAGEVRRCFSAACPEVTASTSKPRFRRESRKKTAVSSSSSTIRMVPFTSGLLPFCRRA